MHDICYLTDIFGDMDVFVIDATESLEVWINKLLPWRPRLESGNYETLHDGDMQSEKLKPKKLSEGRRDEVGKHLKVFNKSFSNYFSPEILNLIAEVEFHTKNLGSF